VEEPLPQYAHQVVYDLRTQTAFMHGGNAGFGGAAMEQRDWTDGTGSGMDGEDGEEESSAGEGRGGDGRDRLKERRLDDFWCMKLHRYVRVYHSCMFADHILGTRPVTDEIIQQATYQIRRQRCVLFGTQVIMDTFIIHYQQDSRRCAKNCLQRKP